MRKLWILLALSIPIMIEASLLDFATLNKAEQAYHDGNYTQAIRAYKKVANKNDQAKYNFANSYYKAKKYKEAKALYESIKAPSLAFNKWHNIGNCEANLGKIDAGIKAYEKALSIKQDEETKYNLELLKKKKKEQEKKKDKKKDKNKNKDKKNQKKDKTNQKQQKNKKDKNSKQNSKQNRDNKQQKDKQKTDKQKEQKNKEQEKKNKAQKNEQQKHDAAKKKKEQAKKQKAMQAAIKKEPISDKEVKKYLKMLDKRGINTLMVPLKTKGANDEETTPW